jgi:hypothetical protein
VPFTSAPSTHAVMLFCARPHRSNSDTLHPYLASSAADEGRSRKREIPSRAPRLTAEATSVVPHIVPDHIHTPAPPPRIAQLFARG